jgi:hypothetical protein
MYSYLSSMAHSDLNELLDALLKMAHTLLTKNGEFYPIGAVIYSDGELRHIAAALEDNDHPPSQTLIQLLTDSFRESVAKGQLRAAGICFDGLTFPPGKDQKQDAICCRLEHYSGEAVNVFQPYIKTIDGVLRYEDIFATERTVEFFSQLPRA